MSQFVMWGRRVVVALRFRLARKIPASQSRRAAVDHRVFGRKFLQPVVEKEEARS